MSAHEQYFQQVVLDSYVEEVVDKGVDLFGDEDDEDILSLGQGILGEDFLEEVYNQAPHGDAREELVQEPSDYLMSDSQFAN